MIDTTVYPHTSRLFRSLEPHERINLKIKCDWDAFAAGMEDKYSAMQLIIAYLNQHHYVTSGACAAGSRRYRQEVLGLRK